jgi:hypothetical protein
MTKKEQALQLIDQLIEHSEKADQEYKVRALAAGKSSRALGESWELHHLKILKEAVNKIN